MRVLIYDVVRLVETIYNGELFLDVVWNTWFLIHRFSFTYETSGWRFLSLYMIIFLPHPNLPTKCCLIDAGLSNTGLKVYIYGDLKSFCR